MAESRPPVSPQEASLPFHDPAFTWDTFENFFCDFLASGPKFVLEENGQKVERRVISARPYGRRGDSQHGIDIKAEMESDEVWAFQCKHYKEWGHAETEQAIAKCSYTANRKFLLVTRELSEECYKEVEKHPGWTLWDSRAISREFLLRCDKEKAARILYLRFGHGWDTKLLGIRGDGPFLTAEAKFEPLRREGRYFHHRLALIGREKWLTDLDSFVTGQAQVTLLSGRGGLGKSRLLAKWSEGFTQRHQDVELRFVSDQTDGYRAALDAFGGKAVVVFDDAHRFPEVRRALFQELPSRRKLKLVVSLRPGALRGVYQELLDAGFDTTDIIEFEELGPLTEEQAMELELARLAIGLSDAPPPSSSAFDMPELDSYQGVLEKVSNLLKAVAKYHTEHVGVCLDLLWELDSIWKLEKDFRVLGLDSKNHPVSAIGEIAKFEYWKSLSVSAAALGWVEKLLSTDEWLQRNHKPSWVLPKLLNPFFVATMDKTGRVGRTIHWGSVLVNLKNTVGFRDRVLALCRRLLVRRDTSIALGVESVLKNAIEYARLGTHGEPPEAWRNEWVAERFKALKLFEEILQDFSEPIIHFQVRQTLLRHVRHCDNKAFQDTCREVFDKVPDSFELGVFRAVLSNAHKEFERPLKPDADPSIQEIEQRWDEFIGIVVDKVIARFPSPEQLFAQFQTWEKQVAQYDYQSDYAPLIRSLSTRHPTLSIALAEMVITRPEHPLDFVFGDIILAATRSQIQERVRLCKAALVTGASDLSAAAIWCITWWQREADLPDEAWDLLATASTSTDRKVARKVADFVWYSKIPGSLHDWKLLIKLPISDDDVSLAIRVVDCVAHLLEKKGVKPSTQTVTEVLNKLSRVSFEASGGLQYALGKISKTFPGAVFMLYWNRVRASSEGQTVPTPIPWDAEELEFPGLMNDPDVKTVVRLLEDELLSVDLFNADRQRLLRIAVFRGGDNIEAWLGKLLNRVESIAHLEALLSFFLSPVESSEVTDYPNFVRDLLKKARTFGTQTYDEVFLELHSHATSHSYTTSAGEPNDAWKKILETVEHRAQEFSTDPELGPLYSHMANEERGRANSMRASERAALGME